MKFSIVKNKSEYDYYDYYFTYLKSEKVILIIFLTRYLVFKFFFKVLQ